MSHPKTFSLGCTFNFHTLCTVYEILGVFLRPWYADLTVKWPDDVRFHEASSLSVLILIVICMKDWNLSNCLTNSSISLMWNSCMKSSICATSWTDMSLSFASLNNIGNSMYKRPCPQFWLQNLIVVPSPTILVRKQSQNCCILFNVWVKNLHSSRFVGLSISWTAMINDFHNPDSGFTQYHYHFTRRASLKDCKSNDVHTTHLLRSAN